MFLNPADQVASSIRQAPRRKDDPGVDQDPLEALASRPSPRFINLQGPARPIRDHASSGDLLQDVDDWPKLLPQLPIDDGECAAPCQIGYLAVRGAAHLDVVLGSGRGSPKRAGEETSLVEGDIAQPAQRLNPLAPLLLQRAVVEQRERF